MVRGKHSGQRVFPPVRIGHHILRVCVCGEIKWQLSSQYKSHPGNLLNLVFYCSGSQPFLVTVPPTEFGSARSALSCVKYPLMRILTVSLWPHESSQVPTVDRPSTPGWEPVVEHTYTRFEPFYSYLSKGHRYHFPFTKCEKRNKVSKVSIWSAFFHLILIFLSS